MKNKLIILIIILSFSSIQTAEQQSKELQDIRRLLNETSQMIDKINEAILKKSFDIEKDKKEMNEIQNKFATIEMLILTCKDKDEKLIQDKQNLYNNFQESINKVIEETKKENPEDEEWDEFNSEEIPTAQEAEKLNSKLYEDQESCTIC